MKRGWKSLPLLLGAMLWLMPQAQAGEWTNSIGMTFVNLKAGCFQMGRDPNFENGGDAELPRHRVCIKNAFSLAKTEVTQAQWVAVMGNNASEFKGRNNPVEKVSWNDAQDFIRRLNNKEGGNHYRLPSEAEWEYAARAGSSSAYHFGDDEGSLSSYAWFNGDRTHPVAQKKANQWGLYDMHGNVWEWVQDNWHDNYRGAPSDGSVWGGGDSRFRVYRGGGWVDSAGDLRSATRTYGSPDGLGRFIGFRLLRQP